MEENLNFCNECDSVIIREFGPICRYCKSDIELPDLKIYTYQKNFNNYEKYIDEKNKETSSKGAKIDQKCDKCGSEQMYYKTMQTRSADEGQTVFYSCDCGHKFKINS